MSTNQPTTDNSSPPPSVPSGLGALAQKPKELATVLFVLTAVLSAIPIVVSIRYGWSGLVTIWAVLLPSFTALAGLYLLSSPEEGSLTRQERVRLAILTLGGACGFVTALLGLFLPFTSAYLTVFSGGMLEWRKNPMVLVKVGAALIGGLVLMFLSLQLARGLERNRATLRRLLYGYNAVFSSLLLLIILVLANVLSFVRLPPFSVMSVNFDWTHSKKYTLNEVFGKLLASVKEPIKVYAFVTRASGLIVEDLEQLLENCRNTNPKFSYTFLSRDLNTSEVEELLKKYTIPEPDGLLVVYGDESSRPMTEFITREDLGGVRSFQPNQGFVRTRFTGENALYKAIDLLSQGKSRPTIYFTQGNGEMEVSQGRDPKESMFSLYDGLSKGNYMPKELRYDGKEKPDELARRLLDESAVVVVARPTQPLPAPLVAALREFVKGSGNRRGKLLVLFDVVADQSGKMVQTGLEPLLAEYRVRVNDDRIITPIARNPRQFISVIDPKSNNPIAQGFRKPGVRYQFLMSDGRTIEILPGGGPETSVQADPLLVVPPSLMSWSEKNLNADPNAVAEDWRKNESTRAKQPEKLLVVAATVSESSAPPRNPMDPHAGMNETPAKPVMVVFSDSTWASDAYMQESDGWSLFNSCLAWLRERPDTGVKINPKTPDMFTPNVPPDGGARLLVLPGMMMVLAIVGLGVGVWVVRRR